MLLRPALLALLSLALASDASGPRDVLGTWYGASTCVKAPWNSACNDEQVRYSFASQLGDSLRTHMVADKIVAGQWDLMGELDFVWDAAAQEWNGDFQNSRVRIRWTYRVSHDTLTGEVVSLPEHRLGRHVVAVRAHPAGWP